MKTAVAISALLFAMMISLPAHADAQAIRFVDCPSCVSQADYNGAAYQEVINRPRPGNAMQKYDLEVTVAGAHLDRLYIVSYTTFTEFEGPFAYQTPLRTSITQLDLMPVSNRETLKYGVEVAMASIDIDTIITIRAPSPFNGTGGLDANEQFLQSPILQGGIQILDRGILITSDDWDDVLENISRSAKRVTSRFGIRSVEIYVKMLADDGSYGYYKVTINTTSGNKIDPIAYENTAGNFIVLDPEEMKNMPKDDPNVQEWLDDPANAEYASTNGLEGDALALASSGPSSYLGGGLQSHSYVIGGVVFISCYADNFGSRCRVEEQQGT